MMTPTPIQVREIIVRLKQAGSTYEEIAELTGVGEATVSRTLRLHRETGSLAPRRPGGGNVSPIHGAVEARLKALVDALPDATVEELKVALEREQPIHTSRPAVQRALTRMGITRKKSLSRPASVTRRRTRSGGASTARS